MSKKQVVIHAGFHKTASSSVQHSLAKNRKLLEKEGFHYPDFTFNGNKRFYNQSVPLFGVFSSEPKAFRHYWYNNNLDPVQINNELIEYLNLILKQYDKLIFSDEFFSKLTRTEFQAAKKLFKEQGYAMRVISYVREPFSALTSAAQQQSRAKPISQVIHESEMNSTRIKNILEAFGDGAEFYSFEKACKHKSGPAGFFFSLIGIELDSEKAMKVNEGGSMQATRLASYINEVCPLFASKTELNPLRNRLDVIPLFNNIKGGKFSFIKSELELVLSHVETERNEISTLLGSEFLPALKMGDIPEHVDWTAEQVKALISLSSQLDLNLLIRIYDYFSGSSVNIQNGGHEALSEFNAVIRHRLRAEATTQQQSAKQVKIAIVKKIKKYFS